MCQNFHQYLCSQSKQKLSKPNVGVFNLDVNLESENFNANFGKTAVCQHLYCCVGTYRSRCPPWHQDIPSLHHRILSQQIKNIMYRMQHVYGVPLVPKICFHVCIWRFFSKICHMKRKQITETKLNTTFRYV